MSRARCLQRGRPVALNQGLQQPRMGCVPSPKGRGVVAAALKPPGPHGEPPRPTCSAASSPPDSPPHGFTVAPRSVNVDGISFLPKEKKGSVAHVTST